MDNRRVLNIHKAGFLRDAYEGKGIRCRNLRAKKFTPTDRSKKKGVNEGKFAFC